MSESGSTWSRLPIFLGVGTLALGLAAGGYMYFRGASPGEVRGNLIKIANLSIDYAKARPSGMRLPQSSADWTPPGVACHQTGKRFPATPAAWSAPPWSDIHFSVDNASAFQYRVVRTGNEEHERLTIEARGDLDCDGIFSRYAISVDPELRVGELTVEREGQ